MGFGNANRRGELIEGQPQRLPCRPQPLAKRIHGKVAFHEHVGYPVIA